MALFLKFSLFICSAILHTSLCLSAENEVTPILDTRLRSPTLLELCLNARHQALTQKIICLFCKGFDLSCFVTTTSTSSPTTSTSTITTPTTSTHTPTTTITTSSTTSTTSAEPETE